MIDDPAEVKQLMVKMEAALSMPAKPTKTALETLKSRGYQLADNQELLIDNIFYAGDQGGITCAIKADENAEEVYGFFITHLEFDPNHPLVAETQAYQHKRSQRLMIADAKAGFQTLLAEAKAEQKSIKKR